MPTLLLVAPDDSLSYLIKRYVHQSGHPINVLRSGSMADATGSPHPSAIWFASLQSFEGMPPHDRSLVSDDVPVIVSASAGEQPRARELGADHCALHPLTYEAFLAAIAAVDLLRGDGTPGGEPPSSDPAGAADPPHPKTLNGVPSMIDPSNDERAPGRPVPRIPHLIYGADYNPEQWPEEVWEEDARLMRDAGVNLVSLGIFAWALLEPAEGRFDFAWLDRVLDILHAQGIAVDLATPTASPPPWMVTSHPEILPLTIDGVTLWHGSRRHYCPHSRAYREGAARVARALADHVRGHPAVALWHVDNEYSCHVGECFCDASADAFRDWLRDRYVDDTGLNLAWGTSFWSQAYSAWEQVMPPRRTPTFINPSQQLDWARFCADSWLACYDEQAAILRSITPGIPVTTNFMGFHKGLDHWAWSDHLDVISNDCYPETSDPGWVVETAMTCDLIRSIGHGRPWLLMEQAAAHVNWRPRNTTKRPGVMRLGSYQAVARGADGVMFFQWRASPAGAEQYHSAMIGHGGPTGRVWSEVTALGGELARLDALVASRVPADVAILFDWSSWWALEGQGKPSSDVRLMDQVRAVYEALHVRHVTVDFAHPSADLSRYRLVIAPALHLVDATAVANIRGWVGAGGTLLLTFLSGIVDGNDRALLGGYPAPFRDLLGLVVEEWAPYPVGGTNQVRTSAGDVFDTSLWSDVVRLEGAEALAVYTRDFYAASPAVTRHRAGAGTTLYAGTRLDVPGTGWLIERACEAAGIATDVRTPADVEIVRRVGSGRTWTFVLNHSDAAVEVGIERPGLDVLSGMAVASSVRLGAKGVVIISSPDI